MTSITTASTERRELLAAFGGGGEHGAHAVVAGPDGALWLMNGNMSSLPPGLDEASPFAHAAEDVLLPRLDDPRGHAVGVRSPGGRLLRTDRDGKHWEIIAAGMRNPYDVAFGPDGEPFAVDADMEWDIGLPWYRAPRVVHLVSGGEFGWRSGSAKLPADTPDTLPAVADLDLASPTGATFGTSLRFKASDRTALFVGDWAYGRILAIHLSPNGASWSGHVETFATGRPLNVTDLAPGPDGALWFVTGGRGTQSGLYRLVFDGYDEGAMSARDENAASARSRRRMLATFHRAPDPKAVDVAWPSLGAGDPFVRQAARVAIEHQPVGAWRDRALHEPDAAAAIEALMALARTGDASDRTAVLDALGRFAWSSLDSDLRPRWLRVYAIALARGATSNPGLVERLDPLFPTGDFGLDRQLLELLVYLEDRDVAERALARLESVSPADAIAFALPLRLLVADAWTPTQHERLFQWLARARATKGGGLSFGGYLDHIAKDALARAPESARKALATLGERAPTQPSPCSPYRPRTPAHTPGRSTSSSRQPRPRRARADRSTAASSRSTPRSASPATASPAKVPTSVPISRRSRRASPGVTSCARSCSRRRTSPINTPSSRSR